MVNELKKYKFEDSIENFIEALEASAMLLAIENIASIEKSCYKNDKNKKILNNTDK